jgi:ketosteroid isomerase-like protein
MFDNGRKLVDKYLTVWQQQPDGGWKIFRNMVIAEK